MSQWAKAAPSRGSYQPHGRPLSVGCLAPSRCGTKGSLHIVSYSHPANPKRDAFFIPTGDTGDRQGAREVAEPRGSAGLGRKAGTRNLTEVAPLTPESNDEAIKRGRNVFTGTPATSFSAVARGQFQRKKQRANEAKSGLATDPH